MECPLESGSTDVRDTAIFVAYAAGTLALPEELALERHMESCTACKDMAAAQGQVWTALDEWTPVTANPDFDARLYARIAQDKQLSWWQRKWTMNWSWKPAMPVAAVCAALLAAFLLKTPAPQPASSAVIQPRVDIEQVERALDDIDMLKQIGVGSPAMPAKPVHSEDL